MHHLNLNSLTAQNLITLILVFLGFAVQYGVISTKIEMFSKQSDEIATVEKNVSALEALMVENRTQHEEMRKDLRLILSKLR